VIGDVVAIHHQVSDELVLKIKAGVIAADMNAHAQFKH
jgi:hypothetical protein